MSRKKHIFYSLSFNIWHRTLKNEAVSAIFYVVSDVPDVIIFIHLKFKIKRLLLSKIDTQKNKFYVSYNAYTGGGQVHVNERKS